MPASATPALLEGRNWAPVSLGRVLILGLGKSGKIAAQYCLDLLGSRVESVSIAAGDSNEDAEAFAQECVQRGAHVWFDSIEITEQFDLCIVSPGIPQTSAFYQNARAACGEIISEVEFAWRESDSHAKWVAITGTNGKTTTTALCAHVLQHAGLKANAVGNIGDTCLAAVAAGQTDVFVAEVSSYQLASTKYFAPDVAVLMNITPDHLSWHGGMDAYVEAKGAVFANLAQRENACAILDATNDTVRTFVRALKAAGPQRGFSYIPMGTQVGISGNMRAACGSEHAAYVEEDGTLVVAYNGTENRLCNTRELRIPGAHNVGNALLAAAAALCLGVSNTQVAEGLTSFTSLPHRIEACGQVQGVACYNDSKATNVDATLKALAAFDPEQPIVLLGGRDKLTELDELVREACKHCKAVVLYGESRDRFVEAFSQASIPVYTSNRMADALDCALEHAQAGDIVLLSPACASFDEFSSFEHRGDVFKDLISQKAAQG